MANANDLIAYDDGQGNTYEMPADQFAVMEASAGVATKTPTADFPFVYNGVIIQFKNGDPFIADSALIAALTAAGAPIV